MLAKSFSICPKLLSSCTSSIFYPLRKLHKYSIKQLLGITGTADENVTVKGWVKSIRKHKDLVFIHMNDGSCLQNIQVITSQQLPSGVTFGACIQIDGQLIPSVGKGQLVEVNADSIDVIGECNPVEFPFKIRKRHPPDYVRQFLHLRPRTSSFSALLRIRNAASQGLHQYFQEEGFCQVHTPILTANDCEGAGEVFQVEPADTELSERLSESVEEEDLSPKHFFNAPTFLTVSGQLHLEVITGALSKAYTFSPTFRAENSRTRLHLSEFYMVEGELAFTESLEDLMSVIEGCLRHATRRVRDQCEEDVILYLKHIAPDGHKAVLDNISDKSYTRLSYTEAISILEKHNHLFQTHVKWGCDLQKEHEQYIVSHCGNIPVFVTDYPAAIKPFYARANDGTETVAAVDLLCPNVGEVVGGSLREERYDILKARTDQLNLSNSLDWYLALRYFGSCPHGGFGIGFERFVQCMLGIANIKDTTIFPRSTHYCKM